MTVPDLDPNLQGSTTMSTRTEQLDELLAMAREAGRRQSRLATLEHDYNWGSASNKRTLRSTLRQARKDSAAADQRLERARARYLTGGAS